MNDGFVNAHYKSFRRTATVCVIGVLSISGLSYYIGSRTLHKNLERQLENAVFAIQEIVIDDNAANRVLSGSTNAPAYVFYREKLVRYINQSKDISLAGIAKHENNEEPLFLSAKAASTNHKPSENLRTALLSLLEDESKKPGENTERNTSVVIRHLDLADARRVQVAAAVVRTETGPTLIYYAGKQSSSLISQQHALLLLESSKALFCIVAIILSIVFYASATRGTLHDLDARNKALEEELQLLKDKEKKLREIIRDNERFNALTLRREERIIQLKLEVNQLLAQMQREKRYNVDKTD